jgi:hypothetical protein
MPPANPDPPIQPDEVSARVREANALLARAIEHLRDARDLLDEAAEVESLPAGLAGGLRAYESVIESLRRTLDAIVKSADEKAELWFSRLSPLERDRPS